MPWYCYVLVAIGVPYVGWVAISIISLQLTCVDLKSRLVATEEAVVAHATQCTRLVAESAEVGKAVARIEGKLDAADLHTVVKALKLAGIATEPPNE